jgi:hypothetical protein
MGTSNNLLVALLSAWGVITAVLVCMLIYRSTLETREEDQIFLDAAGESMAREQRELVSRIERLAAPIKALIALSCALLAVIAGLWFWQGYHNF